MPIEQKTLREIIKYSAAVFIVGLVLFYGAPMLQPGQVTVGTCYDGMKNCHDGLCETGVDCGGPCPPCTVTTVPVVGEEPVDAVDLPAEPAILCPGTLETKMRTAVYNALSEDNFDQLAVNYKVFDAATGVYERISGMTLTTGDVTEYVPCGKQLKVIYHLDNGSAGDIYPVSEYLFPTGASLPTRAEAKVQGCIHTLVYDTTGTEADNNITMNTGQTYTFLKLKIQENTSDAAAQDLVELVDYNVSAYKRIIVVGATKLPGVPTVFNTYDVAYDLGVSLDSYDSAVYDVVVEAISTVNPSGNITFKTVDKCGFFAQDQATFISPQAGTVIGMQNDLNQNVGITGSCEGTATLIVV